MSHHPAYERVNAQQHQWWRRWNGQNLEAQWRTDLGDEHNHLPTWDGAKAIWKTLQKREPWFAASHSELSTAGTFKHRSKATHLDCQALGQPTGWTLSPSHTKHWANNEATWSSSGGLEGIPGSHCTSWTPRAPTSIAFSPARVLISRVFENNSKF